MAGETLLPPSISARLVVPRAAPTRYDVLNKTVS